MHVIGSWFGCKVASNFGLRDHQLFICSLGFQNPTKYMKTSATFMFYRSSIYLEFVLRQKAKIIYIF